MITGIQKNGLKRLEAPGLPPLTLRSDGEVGDWVRDPSRQYFQRGEKWEVVSAAEGKILLERSGGRLPGGKRADKLRSAKELLAKLSPDELREFGPTLQRVIAGGRRAHGVALAKARQPRRTQTKQPRKTTMTNYERELRKPCGALSQSNPGAGRKN